MRMMHATCGSRFRTGRLSGCAFVVFVLCAMASGQTGPAQESDVGLNSGKPVLEWPFAKFRAFGDDREELILFHRTLDSLRTTPADEMPWERLLHDLAQLLDRSHDLHVELDATPRGAQAPPYPGMPRPVRSISMWATIDRLIGELPPAGRREWAKLRGDTGAAELTRAVEAGGVNGLRSVARRFVHTSAGFEAIERIGTHHLDRNAMVLAVRQFEKLRRSSVSRRGREPMLSLKTAAGWAALDRLDRASAVLVELDTWLDTNPGINRNQFALLNEPLPVRLRQLKLHAAQSSEVGSKNRVWTHFLGTPQRTAQAEFSPVGDVLWESITTGFDAQATEADREKFTPEAILAVDNSGKDAFPATEGEMVACIEIGLKSLDDYDVHTGQWHLPAAYPVIADDLAIFRTFNSARAIELKTGELRWEVFMTDYAWEEQFTLDKAENNAARLPKFPQHLYTPINQKQSEFLRIRTRNDRTTGTMSTDGRYLFLIEDCGIPSSKFSNGINSRIPRSGPQSHNRLVCFEVASGFAEWDLGGPSSPKPLPAAGYFFLGPPTIVDGRAYILGELDGRVRLFCLAPKTGDILWEQDIADAQASTNTNGLRRVVGASPTEASGLLICALADGTVVAVDPDLRSTAWTWRYRNHPPPPPGIRQPARFRGPRPTPHVSVGRRWRDLAVMDAEGLVVISPQDADVLICLDIVSGELVWNVPRNDGLYLATVYQDQVVVVEDDGVRGLSLVDGANLWRVEFDQRRPCGRGLRTKHVLHVPLRTVPVPAGGPVSSGVAAGTDAFSTAESEGLIASIDLHEGSLLVETKTPNGRPPGNLVAAHGVLVSQGYAHVMALPAVTDVEEELLAETQSDESSAALAKLARLRLHQGRFDAAVEGLKLVVAKSPRAIPSDLVLRAVMHEIRSTGRAQSDLLELFASVSLLPVDQLALNRVRIELMLQNNQPTDAFDLLVRTPVSQDGVPLIMPSPSLTQAGPEWRAAQLADLYERMTDEQRLAVSGYEPDLTQVARMRDWLSKFGSLSESASDVRMKLAASLDPSADLIEIESLLSAAMADKKAVPAEVARNFLWLESGHGQAARSASKDFVRRWSSQSLPGNLTAADVASEWLQHETIQKLPQSVEWPESATVRIEEAAEAGAENATSTPVIRFALPHIGTPSVVVEGWQFEISPEGVTALDELGQELWTVGPDEFPNVEYPQVTSRRPAACVASDGHLLAIMLGEGFGVFDISATKPKRLWSRSLRDATEVGMPSVRMQNQGIDFARRIPVLFLSQSRLVGLVDCLAGGCLVYRTQTTMHCVDAVTGRLKWRRPGVRVSSRTMSDGRYLTLADYDGLQIQLLQVLDLQTGRIVRNAIADITGDDAPLKDFQFLDKTGRNLIGRRRAVINAPVECFDPLTGQRLWQHSLTAETSGFWLPAGRTMLVGLDGSGLLKVCDKRSGRLLLETKVPPTPELQSIAVHETDRGFVLFAPTRFQRLQVSMNSVRPLKIPFVGGLAHGVDIDSGKVSWTTDLPQQFAPLPQSQGLPFVQLRCRRSQSSSTPGQGSNVTYPIDILDVRTGQVVKSIPETTRPPETPLNIDADKHEVRIALHGERKAIIDFRQTSPDAP